MSPKKRDDESPVEPPPGESTSGRLMRQLGASGDDRLLEILRAVDRIGASDATRDKEILQRRADDAAADRSEIAEPDGRLVGFEVGGERFGVALASVAAVGIVRSMVLLPGVPPVFAGVLNVRGRFVSAIHLRRFLDAGAGAPRRIADADKAVTLAWEDRELVVLAEELLGVREYFDAERRHIEGAASDAPVREMLVDGMQMLDVAALFRDPRLAALQAVRGRGQG